ncbi:MAG: type IV toxin-antitoxin system AbiEi family antitoxin domain-containing protein [Elusimicrobiota bacterium]
MVIQAGQNRTVSMSHAEQTAYFALIRAGSGIATSAAVASLLQISFVRASSILYQLNKKGAARRIGKGKYAIVAPEAMRGTGQFAQDPLIVAAQLMKLVKRDYAVAYASAAYLHGLLEQIPQTAQVMIGHDRRAIRLSQTQLIRFIHASPWKFFGTEEMKYQDQVLIITDPEKTVLDCLDRLDLAGGLDQAAQVLAAAVSGGKLNGRKVARDARLMRTRSLIQRLGYLLEREKLLPETVRTLQPLKHPVPCLLDPASPRGGAKLNPRWQVVENAKVTLRGLR